MTKNDKNNQKEVEKVDSDVKQKAEKEEKEDSETEKLKQKVEGLENQIKRVLADYQNLEKRVREDRVSWIRTANKDLLLRFLPVLDTLILASKHSEDKSLEVTTQQFLQALKDEGVEKIETEGKAFDPNTMEAIGTQEGKEGEVIEETRMGYMIRDRVLRVAQVIVGEGK
ncbi:MAG: nucleotide exchange factor GrpE [Candidatus Levyibacteriota bacterium]|nr:MAG: nucleotide exchange factor GrpE [Candidatus Levybacteria bacterium]